MKRPTAAPQIAHIGAIVLVLGLLVQGPGKAQTVPMPDDANARPGAYPPTWEPPMPKSADAAVGEPDEAGSRTQPPGQSPGRGSAVSVLRKMSQSSDAYTRRVGLEGLGVAGAASCREFLTAVLWDSSPAVRSAAVRSLVAAGPNELCESVMAVYTSGTPWEMESLDVVLPALREPLAPGMLACLLSEGDSSTRRMIAARCLGKMRAASVTFPLADLARSEVGPLAVVCTDALLEIRPAGGAPLFAGLVNHPNREVRWLALQGLAATGGPDAVVLIERAASDYLDRDFDLSMEAVVLLGTVGSESSIPVLLEVMRSRSRARPFAAESLRRLTGAELGNTMREWADWHARWQQAQTEAEPAPSPPLRPRTATMPSVPSSFAPGWRDEEEQAPQEPSLSGR